LHTEYDYFGGFMMSQQSDEQLITVSGAAYLVMSLPLGIETSFSV